MIYNNNIMYFDKLWPNKITPQKPLTYDDFYNYYTFHLMELAVSRFKWTGLPDYIPIDIVERTLISNGIGCMTYGSYGLQFFACAPYGTLNIYGVPTSVSPYPLFGSIKTNLPVIENGRNGVIIYNNIAQTTDLWIIDYYARQLASIKQTQYVNITAQKTTQLIATDKKAEKSMREAYSKQQLGAQVLFVDPSFDRDSLGVYSVTAPVVFDKLQEQLDTLWDEVLTMLGINTPAVRKKERLVVDEANANNNEIEQNSMLRLRFRQQACETLNNMYGLNINVSLTSQDIEIKDMLLDNLLGGDDNGGL